jgi:hypothetical protein
MRTIRRLHSAAEITSQTRYFLSTFSSPLPVSSFFHFTRTQSVQLHSATSSPSYTARPEVAGQCRVGALRQAQFTTPLQSLPTYPPPSLSLSPSPLHLHRHFRFQLKSLPSKSTRVRSLSSSDASISFRVTCCCPTSSTSASDDFIYRPPFTTAQPDLPDIFCIFDLRMRSHTLPHLHFAHSRCFPTPPTHSALPPHSTTTFFSLLSVSLSPLLII